MDQDRGVPEMPGNLVSEEVSSYLKSRVSQILRTRYNSFPGSQPVSFTREHLTTLKNRDYLVCEKSDGLRCLLLVLINDDTGEEGTFLIDRENQYYMVPGFHFPRTNKNFDSSHNGTIVDGELVWSKNPTTGVKELRYLVFDCLAMDMNSVMHKNLWKRLYHAQHEFHKPYMELRRAFPDACAQFPFKLDFKNMTQPYKIRKIFQEMKNLTYVSDGLILTCCDTPYIPGTDSHLLKWKPAEENTIDFKIKLEFPIYVDEDLPKHDPNREYPDYDAKPVIKLFAWKGKDEADNESVEDNIKRNDGEYINSFRGYEEWNQVTLTDDEWNQLKATGESFNGRIAEVRRNESGEWKILRFRDDKAHGNYIDVVMKVLKSIEDSVSREELVAAETEIRDRWLQREKLKQQYAQHAQQTQHTQQHAPQKRKLEPAPQKPQQDDDEYYESDGFEELPSYTKTNSPKYGDLEAPEKKRHV
ncbi:hypothetical protein OGAPHI_004220 [Ogataea philodendri]|uniref:mRNA-capping enzyme subunit alpha n=1 Tax=Ogataea philodendri TaxID=1378263 RepID=A0A9P8T4S3_9ASCO|nr:uncharacterized protein OGAPHI_004220 [Ogataea philodendri]KAH3666031.1 hypothetical protein OGAPHI_004220 [Ogataea philodendri]